MFKRRFPQSRAERLIALGRFVLAVASFGAIYLDPLEPWRHAAFTYTLLALYCVYALAAVLWNIASSTTSRRALIISHTIDLAVFGTLNQLTLGTTSPFFVFFVFSILCAMLRFGRRGTIATAVVAVVVYITSSGDRLSVATFELNRFIIRVTYLMVVGSMLVYLAAYQERIQNDLQRIARWPRSPRRDREEMVTQLLAEAASIFGARRALLVYQHLSHRQAWMYTAGSDDLHAELQPSDTAAMLLADDSGTYFSSVASSAPVDLEETLSRTRRAREAPPSLPPPIMERYGIDAVIATPFQGEFVRGRLLLLDGRPPLLEEINLARIAGAVVAGRLDHFHAAERLQEGAVAEERVRVARDLHDSVLQSLTGVALQLHTIPRLMQRDRDQAEDRLGEIEHVIASAQKELRWFIDELRPERGPRDEALGERLATLAQRFRDQWGLEVQNEVAPVVHLLPIATRYEIYAIVNEAVANAAKHAAAKRVSVAVDVDDTSVNIQVADDGKGFPFHGRFDLKTLMASKLGPVTLKERVSSLGGSLILDSSSSGATLAIRMPLRGAGA